MSFFTCEVASKLVFRLSHTNTLTGFLNIIVHFKHIGGHSKELLQLSCWGINIEP